jgi:hypothetical protein
MEERQGRNGGTLKSASPGDVLNPNGRKRGSLNSKTIIKKWLAVKQLEADPLSTDPQPKKLKLSQLDLMVLEQLRKAKEGDTQAFNALLDRLEGKAKVVNEFSGVDGTPIQTESTHRVIFEDYARK